MTKQIWNFDRLTGLLTGEGQADADPMSPGHWLIPASATDQAPPTPGAQQAAVFKDNHWALSPDWRGVLLYAQGEARAPTVLIHQLGQTPIDVGATETPPPAAKARQVAVLTAARQWAVQADWRGVPLWDYSAHPANSLTVLGVTPGEHTLTDLTPPSDYPCAFDGAQWVPDVAAIRRDKLERIKAERNRRTQSGGLRVGLDWFHGDSISRVKHLGLKDRARDLLEAGGTMASAILIAGEAVQWSTMGGKRVAMTVQLAFDLVNAVGEADAALFKASEAIGLALKNSAAPQDFNILTGWPVSFGG